MARFLIAPDKFKGTLTARQAAQAIAEGVRLVAPDSVCIEAEIADGGEGTSRIVAGESAVIERYQVVAPDGLHADVPVYIADNKAFLDSADVIGLALLSRSPLRPMEISSYPLGKLVDLLLDRFEEVTVAVGGTATVDGGAGFIEALGARFISRSNPALHIYNITPSRFDDVADIDLSHINSGRIAKRLHFLTDVDVPLIAPEGAMSSLSFARQKGVSDRQLPFLRHMLSRYADLLHADLASLNGAGGGLACVPHLLGATIGSGSDISLQRIETLIDIHRPDAIITGEGCFDAQSLAGKGVGQLIALTTRRHLPLLIVAGCTSNPIPVLPPHVYLTSTLGVSPAPRISFSDNSVRAHQNRLHPAIEQALKKLMATEFC